MQSVSTIVTQTNINFSISPSDLIDLELDDNISQELFLESLEKINENDNTNGLLYILDKVQELVAKQFQDLEELDELVKLIFKIELDSRIVESVFLNQKFQSDTQDLKAIKESFHQLTNILLLPFEYRSNYYWEWQAFNSDWDKYATTNIEVGMEEKYNINIINWTCSCPAYSHSPYLLCKHLVAKKNGSYFLPTFKKTMHQHNYPLLIFDADTTIPMICQENDPWETNKLNIIDNTDALFTSSSNLQNRILETRNDAIDEAKEKLTYYNNIFNSALILYKREKTNDQFIKNFDTLLKLFVKAIKECKEKLNART
ncbi:8143_t:CDS:2 [Gigaspora margarita]|uniref:8143_t:CDS:1 n=1 Tax=Gigaspora margarita TaxID=4874 RepID=A0ABN7W1G3_GIGMA|nr:8143_t:CDS:2 [Gigaspora margarita]